MDAANPEASPRKKIKVQHTLDGAMEDSNAVIDIPRDETAVQSDKETQCGITDFVRSAQHAFTGVLKKRYTDFLVNEILPSGQVLHLDDCRAPRAKKAESSFNCPTTSRDQASDSSEPSLQTLRAVAEPDPVNRKQHKILIRETDDGIEEIDRDERINNQQGVSHVQDVGAIPEEEVAPGTSKSATAEEEVPRSGNSRLECVPSTISDWQSYAGKPGRFELSPEDKELLTAYFDLSVVDDIVGLYNRVLHSPTRRAKDYESVHSNIIADRGARTKIHQNLRRIFQSRLESMTDKDGAITICAVAEKSQWISRQHMGKGSTIRQQPNKRLQWQELGGAYLHFTLYKENKDTMEAVSWLSRQLKVPAKSFQFAGTKDRRGVTVQRLSAHRVLADRMVNAGRTLKQAKIGNYQYMPHELRLGDLMGNEFVITLRDCQFNLEGEEAIESRFSGASAVLNTSVRNLREYGFINYYGLQRFGTFSTRTDSIGVKILQGDFKGAVDAILNFHPDLLEESHGSDSNYDRIAADDKARAYAISLFKKTGKCHAALESLPRKFSAESSIIRHLSGNNQSNDYQGALTTIPRNLRLMYVHAYQSLVWNVMAGLRWKDFGPNVVEGDLVLINEHAGQYDSLAKSAELDIDGEVVVQPDEEDRATTTDDLFERARALTKQDIEGGKYTMFDVVLPTPGYDILYPENGMAERYRTFMASTRGGGLNPDDMRRGWKDASLSGSYRKLLARPLSDVRFEVKAYTDDNEQFVETDLDKMSKREKHAKSVQQQRLHTPDCAGDAEQSAGPELYIEQKLAVIFRMQLGSSQYATMALREMMGPGGLQTYKPDYGGGRS